VKYKQIVIPISQQQLKSQHSPDDPTISLYLPVSQNECSCNETNSALDDHKLYSVLWLTWDSLEGYSWEI